MHLRHGIIGLLLCLAASRLPAQALPLAVGKPAPQGLKPQMHLLMPQAVRANPQGHSPICRVETHIERRSPVGVWMRLDGPLPQGVAQPGWAYLRLRVPLSR